MGVISELQQTNHADDDTAGLEEAAAAIHDALQDRFGQRHEAFDKSIKDIRSELADIKAAASAGGGSTGLALGGLAQMEKRLGLHESWQSRHAKSIQDVGDESNQLRQRCERMETQVSNLVTRMTALEGEVRGLPEVLRNILGSLPPANVTIPEKSLHVDVAPAHVVLSQPEEDVVKNIEYDEQSRPTKIIQKRMKSKSVLDPVEQSDR